MAGFIGKSIYDYAVSLGLCDIEAVKKAKKYAEETNALPQKALIDTAVLKEEELLELLSKMYDITAVKDINTLNIDKELVKRFDEVRLIKLKIIPCSLDKVLKVAIANPTKILLMEDYIKEVIGKGIKVEFLLITEDTINKYYYGSNQKQKIDYEINEVESLDLIQNDVYDISSEDISVIVSAVNKIFYEAVIMRASDIHIEPYETKIVVRFRIDGLLMEVLTLPKGIHRQLANRIKTMANMDVNDNRNPQSGGIRLKINSKVIDLRVSSLPITFGEKLTIRVLDKNAVNFSIDMMCFEDGVLKKFMNIINKPSGIVLITGPTGSGKSSSLYSVMSHLNDPSRCIITLEQPVEYRLEGLNQVFVDEGAGLSFGILLREVLRQDPDTILIGEIRDVETARIAIQASNTGHQVFSTLHTNSAASSVMRLVEMGVESYWINDSLNAVVNQRLVRRVCNECKTEYKLSKDSPFRKLLESSDITLYRGIGCEKCNGIGYKGRLAIQELLVLDDEISASLTKGATTSQIHNLAVKNGMIPIAQDGILKAISGLTTLDEVHRIIHFDL